MGGSRLQTLDHSHLPPSTSVSTASKLPTHSQKWAAHDFLKHPVLGSEGLPPPHPHVRRPQQVWRRQKKWASPRRRQGLSIGSIREGSRGIIFENRNGRWWGRGRLSLPSSSLLCPSPGGADLTPRPGFLDEGGQASPFTLMLLKLTLPFLHSLPLLPSPSPLLSYFLM